MAAQPAIDGLSEQVRLKHGVDRARCLPKSSHAAHAVEESSREVSVAEEMVVEEVQMPPGKSLDLAKRTVHSLGVERAPTLEECLLVTEVTNIRTSARNHDGIWNQVEMTLDEIPTNRRQTCESARLRLIAFCGITGAIFLQKLRPGVLAGAKEDSVGVFAGLIG